VFAASPASHDSINALLFKREQASDRFIGVFQNRAAQSECRKRRCTSLSERLPARTLGLALGGQAGARVSQQLHRKASHDTSLRLVRQSERNFATKTTNFRYYKQYPICPLLCGWWQQP